MEEAWDLGASCTDKGAAGGRVAGCRNEIETLRRSIIGEKGDRSTVLAGLRT